MPDRLDPTLNQLSAEQQRQMTHEPEPYNPAPDMLSNLRSRLGEIFSGVDLGPIHRPGTEPKDYLREMYNDPEVRERSIKQGSQFNWGGVIGRPPVSLSPGFSQFEAERAAAGADRLSAPPLPKPDLDASASEFLQQRLGFVPAGNPQSWARMHGWSADSKTSEAAVGPLGGNQAAREAFTKHIAPHMDEETFANKYFAGMHNPNISMETMRWEIGGPVHFDGPLMRGGRNVGNISRTINPVTGVAEHGYFKLSKELQGTGIAKQMIGNQVTLYNRMGLKYVKLDANIDIGGYAWAKYGFLPNQEGWKVLSSDLRNELMQNRFYGIDPIVKAELARLTSHPNATSLWKISDLKSPDGNGQPVGKSLLIGQYWAGFLNLKNATMMGRFTNYVLGPQKP